MTVFSKTHGLYYDYTGPELASNQNLPRVFLNGIGMTASHWKPLIELLPPGPTLVHDFKDQLRSPKADTNYSMESHADELKTLLDELKFDRVVLIGTSYGSEVAMLFTLKYPSLCAGLVIIDGVSFSDARLKAAVVSWKVAALDNPRVFYRTLIPWNYSAEYIQTHAEDLNAREDGLAALPREYFEGFIRLCDAFLDLDITDRLPEISCPTLVIVGEMDILKDRTYSQVLHEKIAGSRLVEIPGAGHAVVIENPRTLADTIGPFLLDL